MYITIADLRSHVPERDLRQLTDDEQMGSVNQDRVDEAIGYASELIDGYLRGRYTLPLSTVPELVKKLAVDLAVYRLFSRRVGLMAEEVEARYRNAVKLLEQVQRGVLSMGIESASSGAGNYESNKTSEDRVFPKETLDKF